MKTAQALAEAALESHYGWGEGSCATGCTRRWTEDEMDQAGSLRAMKRIHMAEVVVAALGLE